MSAPSAGWREAKFGQRFTSAPTWEKFPYDAERERLVMVAEFNAWAIKQRHETEYQLISAERHMMTCAPFAQAGLDKSQTPNDMPLVVIEFAVQSLEVIERKRELALLNVYYEQQARMRTDVELVAEKGNEAEISQLWEWFLRERAEAETEKSK